MGVCIILYICGIVYMVMLRKNRLPKICHGQTALRVFWCMAAANTLAMFLFLSGNQYSISEIERNTYGKGKKAEELEITVGKEIRKKKITVEIQEQKYTPKQIKKMFETSVKQLNTLILGENKSRDHVDHDLNLVRKIPDTPIEVTWELNRYDVLNVYGEIQFAQVPKEGVKVKLQGTLSYEGEEFPYLTDVTVYPRKVSGETEIADKVKKLVKEEDEKTREISVVKLPEKLADKTITWNRKNDSRGYVILLLGMTAAVAVSMLKKQEEKKKNEQERKQMVRDYPEIVSKIVLLLGAGMTVRNAWKKVVIDYAGQREVTGEHKAYEEMAGTLHEIQSGVTEAEGYEHFGRRCGLPQYLKLGALLSQNLKKGTSGLTELLKTEAVQAFEERKNLARKTGEEASTKLLLPMFLMLAIVLVIVIVPAFLSVQL